MEQRKPKRALIIALALLIVAVGAFLTVYFLNVPKTAEGLKTLTIHIVHGNGTEKEATLSTRAEYLREALEEQSLIAGEEGPYGLFIQTVDGESADQAKQQWWCLTKSQEQLMTGVDTTPIQDGEHYELTLTTGY